MTTDAVVMRIAQDTAKAEAGRVVAEVVSTYVQGHADDIRGHRGIRGSTGARGTDGSPGAPGAKGDPGLMWAGPWRAGQLYGPDEAVEFEGSSYIATEATRAKPPGGAWQVLAQRGADATPAPLRIASGPLGVSVRNGSTNVGFVNTLELGDNLSATLGADGAAVLTAAAGDASSGGVPVGGIIMWSGAIATIPVPTWQLCDGTLNSPGPDLRDKFVVGATSDQGGAAKTNIEGSLKVSATQTGASIADHAGLTHVLGAVGDHTGLSHANGAVASHPDLTHAALSHAAMTFTHPDHSVASATHTHASGADVSVASYPVVSSLASRPAVSHSHAARADLSMPAQTIASGVDISIASQAIASGTDISIASQAIASGADISIASSTGTAPSQTVAVASQAGVSSFATSTNRSGVVSVLSQLVTVTSQSHTHAAATASRPTLPVAAATGSRPTLPVAAVTGSRPTLPVASAGNLSAPSTTGIDASGVDVSVASQALASALASRPSLTGSAAAASLTHPDHSFASLSHQAIGTHSALTHAVTQPDAHGSAGTLTHAFTQPSAHTLDAHSTVAIVPAYFALAFIQRMS